MDKTKLLLVVTCLALAGVVVWQHSADVAMVVPPKPLELTAPPTAPPKAPSGSVAAAPAADATAVAPVENATADPVKSSEPVKKPAPRRDVRRPAPAATTTNAANSNPSPSAPAPTPVTEEHHPAEREVAAAVPLKQDEQRFMLIHDHSKGNFEKDPKASCVGELVLSPTEIKFEGTGAGESHHFEATWAEVLDAGSNKFFGSGIGGFHLTITENGKYKNLNFAPKSKDKGEAKMIIDLLNASARKTEREK